MVDDRSYQVGAIANYLIGWSRKKRRQVRHIKLQKLVYVSYGICLAGYGRRLFNERIEAWPYGPVIPELYHEFKRFGPYPIKRLSSNFNYNTGKFEFPLVSDDDIDALRVLGFVWDQYGRLSDSVLVDITHTEGSPWQQTIAQGSRNPRIQDDLIRDHYLEVLHDWEKETVTL